ncbi:DUF4214 domain-containing protein [Burkholderia cepacia]|uniref:DUF4214 domain-containing protein n=1 Tax=Burkholderia cepacia TaxID=292 RepID=UPI00264C6329|nr:DUF4214 domain-containing protein [Burkholderia cepacia]MDN7443021.1 DUF4214 domain-containing protein [Burkholderia cepacia]
MEIVSIYELIEVGDNQFVEHCYRKLLGRSPDPQGHKFYSEQLSSGQSKTQIAKNIAASGEARQRGIVLSDTNRELWHRRLCGVPLLGRMLSPSRRSNPTKTVVSKAVEETSDAQTGNDPDTEMEKHGTGLSELRAALDKLETMHWELDLTLHSMNRHFSASLHGTVDSIRSLQEQMRFQFLAINASLNGAHNQQRQVIERLERLESAIATVERVSDLQSGKCVSR